MAQQQPGADEVVIGKEFGTARVIILNRPRQLNVISDRVVYLLADFLEKWEKDDGAGLVIFKGAGRAFSAGGDLKMFYEHRAGEVTTRGVYSMYWLCYHLHSYKKTTIAFANGLAMGGGGALVVASKFSIVTEKTLFATPEVTVGLHTDCSLSYILSRLDGSLGEYLALTGARLSGKDMIGAGLATHFVPSEKLEELEKSLLSLSSGDEAAVRALIQEFSIDVKPDKESILNKVATINKCFSADSVEEIIQSLEVEAQNEGHEWIVPIIKTMKNSSPTALKIILKSIREGRKQTLAQCLKKEFRLTINILRSVISGDIYEGIRALNIDKDNSPKWNPASLEEVEMENIARVFQPFGPGLELQIPSEDELARWDGKYEDSGYAK